MKKIYVPILILIIILTSLSYVFSGGITELSKKAATLKIGMSKAAVVKLLDNPTWAVIPSDKGEISLPDPRIKLELYWKNPGCAPVVVQFDSSYKSTGWDEGRAYCGKDAHLFELPAEFSCKKSDRAKFCGAKLKSRRQETSDNPRAKAKAIWQALKRLVKRGREMELLRHSDNLDTLQECGKRMRKYQKEAKLLRDRADSLPKKYFYLQVAAGHLNRCVSCLPKALESCDSADFELKNARSSIEN